MADLSFLQSRAMHRGLIKQSLRGHSLWELVAAAQRGQLEVCISLHFLGIPKWYITEHLVVSESSSAEHSAGVHE